MLSRCVLTVILICILTGNAIAQAFVHPGINQNSNDLARMKQLVLAGQEPWKSAFDRMKASADAGFTFRPYTHVLRGGYGKPNIGGNDLSKSAEMAYNNALIWHVTGDKKYANKAIEIINAWSPVLWDFDYNDAKLLAGWTGHMFCNAAEILRYTNSGWQQKDINAFSKMLMTVYYPLIRYYFTQANGNWDGAIIHSILAIAIFTDNRAMFNNAVDHFLHAPVNGSLFKYIYPSGQCQESMRDQGHVQLGLGEFAGAAQIAFTQGVDFFSIADNRLGLGVEYTARFLMGDKPHSYGVISERAKELRDDYEYVYRHYAAQGVELPFTKKAADSIRSKASRSILTSVRAETKKTNNKTVVPKASPIGYIAGAGKNSSATIPADAIIVAAGDSIQSALNAAAGTGKWVFLKAGIHTIKETLKIPSGITICGEGLGTIIFNDPSAGPLARDAMVNADSNLHDLTIRDLVIEGSNKTDPGTDPNNGRSYRNGYNRGGIVFRSLTDGQMKNLNFIQVTVRNCTYNGVFISGSNNVNVTNCDFTENGAGVVPGPKLQHNLLLTHCSNVNVKDSRLDTSPYGSGIAMDHCNTALIENCEIARNGHYGIQLSESKKITAKNNLIEGNDRSGVMLEFLYNGCDDVSLSNNIIHYNNGFGFESYAARNLKFVGNTYAGNGKGEQEKISGEKYIVME